MRNADQHSARLSRTHARLTDAAVEEIAARGWDGISFVGISRAASLSTRPIYDRYPSQSHLGADVWSSAAGDAFGQALTHVLEVALSSDSVDAPHFAVALEPFIRPEPVMRAARELMAAAWFDDVLRDAVMQAHLGPIVSRISKARSRTSAAQATYVTTIALGLLLAADLPHAGDADISEDCRDLLVALANPTAPKRLPVHRGLASLKVPSDDARESALFTAMLEEVAERGYASATTARVARRAGVSEGFIFGRFPSKVELFIAATKARHLAAFMENDSLVRALASRHGEGIAEAVMWRQHFDPALRGSTTVAMEQLRLGWHNEAIRQIEDETVTEFLAAVGSTFPARHRKRAASRVHWDVALGYGASLVSAYVPDAHTLPFDVVTVPLLEAQGR